jgi:hypothetical protein
MRPLVKPVGMGTKLLVGVLATIGMIPLLPRIGPTIPPRPLELEAEGVTAGVVALVDWVGPVVSGVSAALLLLVAGEDDAAGSGNRPPIPDVNESSKPGELGVGVAAVGVGTTSVEGTESVRDGVTSVGVVVPSVLDELVLAAPDAGGLEAPGRMPPRFEVRLSRRPPPDELAVGVGDAATGEGTATGEEP